MTFHFASLRGTKQSRKINLLQVDYFPFLNKTFFMSLFSYLLSRIRNLINSYRILKCKLRGASFEGDNLIGKNVSLTKCKLGYGSYVGNSVSMSYVKIGRFCSLGSIISNSNGDHPTSVFVSTHPAFFLPGYKFSFCKKEKFKALNFLPSGYLVEIGNDVWIGNNVSILDGLIIGDGAIIGTGAVVTKDVPPYSINVGVPAKPISYRFSKNQIIQLLNLKWWNKDLNWIKKNCESFDDIEKFTNSVQ